MFDFTVVSLGLHYKVAGELPEADPTKCEAYGPGRATAEINTTATFKISVVDQQNRPCTRPTQLTTRLQSRVDGSIVETAQTSEDAATYQVQYTATQRGRHQLSVAVNGEEIPGSPFGVFVSIAPTALGVLCRASTSPTARPTYTQTRNMMLLQGYTNNSITSAKS